MNPADDPAKTDPDRGRFSVRKKTEAVMRLLRGEDVDKVSRELRVTAATLTRWREEFVAGGRAQLKNRPAVDGQDETLLRLKAKVGELTMANELLTYRAQRAEELAGRSPFPERRSRR